MKKEDLKTGMIVEYRDGTLRLVVGDRLFDNRGYDCSALNSYNYELKSNFTKNNDIVAVYNDFEKSKCLWKRVEIKKEDLKNGAIVKLRNGNSYIKIDDILLNINQGSSMFLSSYDDNLKYDSDIFGRDQSCDVIEVENVDKNVAKPYMNYKISQSKFIKINN